MKNAKISSKIKLCSYLKNRLFCITFIISEHLTNQNFINESVVRCRVLILKSLKIRLIKYLANVPY